ncbi:reverse transcriptase domain-containing protein [Tanacetum coccineum]
MPPKRNGMSAAAIEQLIAQRIADALLTYKANQNSGNVNGNGNGNGNGSDNGNGSHDLGSGSRRTLHTTHGCTTIRHDVAYEMSWKSLMKMMTEAYYPRNEIQKLENELWNLTVKGTDLVGHTQCFQKLALLCSRMLPEETDKLERFIWGLPDSIRGNVTSSKPTRLQEAIKIANNLMDKKNVARAYTARPNEKKEYAGTLPLCNKCKLHHNGSCNVKCTNYKKVGHMAKDCRSPIAASGQRTLTCFECGNQEHYRSERPRLKN